MASMRAVVKAERFDKIERYCEKARQQIEGYCEKRKTSRKRKSRTSIL